MATPDELRCLDRVQALMSLLEGHGHVVMDRIGARELVSWRRMSQMAARRRDNPRVAALLRLTGLEMKMRQYEEGREFILAVERRAGRSAVDLAWESPDALPTRAEDRRSRLMAGPRRLTRLGSEVAARVGRALGEESFPVAGGPERRGGQCGAGLGGAGERAAGAGGACASRLARFGPHGSRRGGGGPAGSTWISRSSEWMRPDPVHPKRWRGRSAMRHWSAGCGRGNGRPPATR